MATKKVIYHIATNEILVEDFLQVCFFSCTAQE